MECSLSRWCLAYSKPRQYLHGGWYCGGLENLTTIEGLEYIDTSNEHYFNGMFSNCKSLASLDLSTFDGMLVQLEFLFEGEKKTETAVRLIPILTSGAAAEASPA